MRTLKKTLCLILCLAMMVGLCAIGANAITFDDYKDKDTIQYEKAVTLLTALGVVEGDDNGNFRATDELNRAEGAAIMARMLSKNIPEGTSSFTDMAGYGWAQKYVKFCEDYNIIAGYGDGKFGPGDKLTTTQFAKMLICALGYDPVREGFVNDAAWSINVTKKVTSLGLADGLKVYLPGANIQREQAAQLAYNTLFQPMVFTDGQSLELSWIGALFGGREGLADLVGNAMLTLKDGTPVPNRAYDYQVNGGDNVLEFIEAAFPQVKVKTEDDVFAIPTNYWFMGKTAQDDTYRDEKLLCTTLAADILAVYDVGIDEVTAKDVYEDAGFNGGWDDIEVYENGDYNDDLRVYNSGALSRVKVFSNEEGWEAYAGAQAILLDMGRDALGNPVRRLAVKYPYLAKVIGVIPGEDRTLTLAVYNTHWIDTPTISTLETDQFEKDDFILIYPEGELHGESGTNGRPDLTILDAKLADAKEGALSKVTLGTHDPKTGIAIALTVGGDKQPVGSDCLANLGPAKGYPVATSKDNYSVGQSATIYMSYGYVLGIIDAKTTYENWIFAYGPGHEIESPFGGSSWTYGYVKQDATAIETRIKTDRGLEEDQIDQMYWTTVTPGDPYSTFVAKAKVTSKNVVVPIDSLKHDVPDLGTDGYKVTADSKTVFILETKKGVFKAITGIHDIPDYSYITGDDAFAYALVPSPGAHAVAVFISLVNTKADSAAPDEPDPIYILGEQPHTKQDENGTTVYAYDAIVDGKVTEVLALAPLDDVIDSAGLYLPTYSGKYLKTVAKYAKDDPRFIELNVDPGAVTHIENDTIVFSDNKDTTYAVAKDVKIYVYDQYKEKLTPNVSLETLGALPEGVITAVATKKDMTIHTIYYFFDSRMEREAPIA